MTPAALIERAIKDGVALSILPSGRIFAKGAQSVIDRWLPAIRQNKQSLVSLLEPGLNGWLGEDWQVYFDERAGIAEFDGGLSRLESEAMAFACCVTEWMNHHPVISSPGRCRACEGGERQGDPLLPYGTITQGHTWLHSRCWREWYDAQKGDAVAALMAMGIKELAKFPEDFGKNGRS